MGVGIIDTEGKWAVNGTPIFIPSELEHDDDSMATSDSGRVESGQMHITWIRSDIHKLNLVYKYLTAQEIEYMKNLMQGKVFTFTYYDNGIKTITAYSSKCSYSVESYALHSDEGGLYKNFKIDVIEM